MEVVDAFLLGRRTYVTLRRHSSRCRRATRTSGRIHISMYCQDWRREADGSSGTSRLSMRSLRNRLTAIARQRADFAAELSDCLKPHGAEPPQSTHHRELQRTIRPKDDTTLIAQCFEGEENTLRHYESALTHDLPAPIRPVVDRQRLAVQAALLDFHGMEMLRKGRRSSSMN